jgi:hypothetical protein
VRPLSVLPGECYWLSPSDIKCRNPHISGGGYQARVLSVRDDKMTVTVSRINAGSSYLSWKSYALVLYNAVHWDSAYWT